MPINLEDLEAKKNVESKTDFHGLAVDLEKNLKQFTNGIESLVLNVKNEPSMFECSKGISFLSMKNMLMLEYLTNLIQLIYLKISGQKICGDSCVQRLAEIRCVLEKSKTVEFKLKYQIDKLLKLAVTSTTDEHDPLSFRAEAANFANTENEGKGEEDEEDDEDIIADKSDADEPVNKKDGLYRPPKIVPVYNDIDETPQEKLKKKMEKMKRRMFSSSMIKDLEKEYSGAPEEIRNEYANILETETSEQRHKIDYEEENFVRKPLTKTEMMKVKRLQRGTNLNSLTSFDDARLILDENINMEEFMKTKNDKKKSKGKQGKGKGKKKGTKKKKIRYT